MGTTPAHIMYKGELYRKAEKDTLKYAESFLAKLQAVNNLLQSPARLTKIDLDNAGVPAQLIGWFRAFRRNYYEFIDFSRENDPSVTDDMEVLGDKILQSYKKMLGLGKTMMADIQALRKEIDTAIKSTAEESEMAKRE